MEKRSLNSPVVFIYAFYILTKKNCESSFSGTTAHLKGNYFEHFIYKIKFSEMINA